MNKAFCTAGQCVLRGGRLAHSLALSHFILSVICISYRQGLSWFLWNKLEMLSEFSVIVWSLSLMWAHISFRTLFSYSF